MDWSAKVELYEQIRREYEFGIGSVIGVARKLGVHRRMVREAVRTLPCFSVDLRDGGRVGLECQGGAIRADTSGV